MWDRHRSLGRPGRDIPATLFNLAPAEYHGGIQNMRHSCGAGRNE